MKSFLIIFALTSFSFLTSGKLSAQVSWVGGFPGQETNWEHPRNWSDNHVPGWDDVVLIPNQSSQGGFYPVIDSKIEPIAYLMIEGGAELSVSPYGELNVDGDLYYTFGIYLVGELENFGVINIHNVTGDPIRGELSLLENHGQVYQADDETNSTKVLMDARQSTASILQIEDMEYFAEAKH